MQNYRSEQHKRVLAEIKLLFLIISEQSEEIFHNSALCTLHFALCTLHFALCPQFALCTLLIPHTRGTFNNQFRLSVRAFYT